jgi:hypothetical protein
MPDINIDVPENIALADESVTLPVLMSLPDGFEISNTL